MKFISAHGKDLDAENMEMLRNDDIHHHAGRNCTDELAL